MGRLQAAGWTYSIGVRQQQHITAAITAIPEQDWRPLADYPQDGEAQIAQTMLGAQRLIIRRTRLLGDQAELWPDWRHFAFLTNRTDAIDRRDRASPARRRRARDPRPQRPGLGALPVGQVLRQRGLDGDRRARAQPAALDNADRAARHHHPRRPDATTKAADDPRPPGTVRPNNDTANARPVALGARLPRHSAAAARAATPRRTPGPLPRRPAAAPPAPACRYSVNPRSATA